MAVDWTDIAVRAHRVVAHANQLELRVEDEETLPALNSIRAIMTELQEMAAGLVETGAREGITQKKLADALGIPASTLRGLKRSVA